MCYYKHLGKLLSGATPLTKFGCILPEALLVCPGNSSYHFNANKALRCIYSLYVSYGNRQQFRLMSLPHNVLRSTPYNVSKLPSIILSCQPRNSSLWHTNSTLRCLATIDPGPSPLQDVNFTSSPPCWNVPPPASNSNSPRKQDDERKVKLGTSKLLLYLIK